MKYFLAIITLFFGVILIAQDLPTPIITTNFCQPGVNVSSPSRGLSLEYILHPGYTVISEISNDGDKTKVDSKDRLDFKVKIPIIIKDRTKVLAGFYHSFEKYEFDNIAPPESALLAAINDVKLKRSRFTAYYFRSLNDQKYLAFRFGASFNGDYSEFVNFDNRYAVYRVGAILGIKKRPDRELGLGVLYNYTFGRHQVFPFVAWNQSFSRNWGISTVLPVKMEGVYRINSRNIFSFGGEYYSSGYSVDVFENPNQPTDFIFRSSAIQFSVELNKRLLTRWTWLAIKAGYALNFDSAFRLDNNRDNDIKVAPSNSVFISATLFLSPPNDCDE